MLEWCNGPMELCTGEMSDPSEDAAIIWVSSAADGAQVCMKLDLGESSELCNASAAQVLDALTELRSSVRMVAKAHKLMQVLETCDRQVQRVQPWEMWVASDMILTCGGHRVR